MTKDHLKKLFDLMTGLWPSFEVTDKTTASYLLVFADIPLKYAIQAVKHIATNSERPYAPTPQEISQAIKHINLKHKKRYYHTASTEQRRAHTRLMLKRGFVPIVDKCEDRNIIYWEPRDNCTTENDRWIKKIEYAMQYLGPKKVNEELRKIVPPKTSLPGTVTALVYDKDFTKKYNHLQDVLCDAATLAREKGATPHY